VAVEWEEEFLPLYLLLLLISLMFWSPGLLGTYTSLPLSLSLSFLFGFFDLLCQYVVFNCFLSSLANWGVQIICMSFLFIFYAKLRSLLYEMFAFVIV
jgi:hypothetical protein